MENIFDVFRLKEEQEDFDIVIKNIEKGVEFKGTNLWILIFAIFLASLGLNVNSTAVIIGAMLVSPLMGPIMGLGLGIGINDILIFRKSLFNYLFAAGIALITSTVYFIMSPINDAHSEILSRTSPNIYDVFIALFGGLAGILALSSKKKGNVIPGVAIATALMPPLCTAGYGISQLNFEIFIGAFYLFLINTVFIALATLITTRVLKFPLTITLDKKNKVKAIRIVWIAVLVILLPSIYLGFDFIQQNKFTQKANLFIENEANIENDYLLKRKIDAKNKSITLTYGGELIDEKEIAQLKSKLKNYNLQNTILEIKQGFSSVQDNNNEPSDQLTKIINDKEIQIQLLKSELNNINSQQQLSKQIFRELKIQYPILQSCILQSATLNNDSSNKNVWLAIVSTKCKMEEKEKIKIENWLKVRMNIDTLKIYFE
jgi:uncharacterized hydrophobic protein (TIGR00271 family)